MRRGLVKAMCLVIVFAVTLPECVEAQQPPKDAAYWSTSLAQMKPRSTVRVKLIDGHTLQGRLLDTTADDMNILVQRSFRRGIERRVRYDAVKNLSQTHPNRDQLIAAAAGMGVALLLLWAMLGGLSS